MASVDITSVVIQAKSDGIDQATDSLNKLADASVRAESATANLGNTSKKTSSTYADGVAAADKLLSNYQKQVDLLGANTSQQMAYNVALKGGNESQKALAESLGQTVDAYKNSVAADKFLKSLEDQAMKAGLTGKALRDYNAEVMRTKAAQLGVADQASGFIQKLQDTEKVAGHAASGASGITRELIVLGHEASQGQFSRFGGSMIVLAERFDAGGKAVRAFTSALEAAGGSLTAVLVPIAAVLVGVGSIALAIYEMVKGANELQEFNKAMILTGGITGQTRESIEAMSETVKVFAHNNISTAESMVTALNATGKFTSETLQSVSEAALSYQRLTGKTTEEAVSMFEDLGRTHGKIYNNMQNTVAEWANKQNDAYHFLSAAQYEHIRLLAQQGEGEKAIIETTELMNESFNRQEVRLGVLTKIWIGWGLAISGVTHFLRDLGKDWMEGSSMTEQVKKQADEVLRLSDAVNTAKYGKKLPNGLTLAADPSQISRAEAELKAAQDKFTALVQKANDDRTAIEQKAQLERANQEGVAGQRTLDFIRNQNRTQAQIAKDQADQITQAAADVNKSNILTWKAKYQGDKAGMDAAMQLAIQNGSLQIITQNQINADIEAAQAKHHDKLGKIKALGFADINLEISKIKEQTQAQIEADTLAIESAKNLYALKKIDILAEQQIIDTAIRHKIEVENAGYAKEQEAIKESMTVRGRTATEIKELQNRAVQDTSTHEKAVTALNKALMENSIIVETALTKAYNDENTANQKVVDGIKQKTADLKAQNEAYAKLPESIRAAGVTDKQMQDAITQAKIDALTTENDALQKNSEKDNIYTQQKIDNNKKIIDSMKDERAQQVIREAQQATNKAAQDYVTAWKQANKQIGDDLASAIIDGGGKGWKKLIKDMEMAFAKMILRPILEPISGAFASLTTTVGASNPGAVDGSGAVGLAATASKTYSALTGGIAASLGTAATGIGNLIGSSAISAFGAGLSGGSGVSSAVAAYTAAGQTATASALSLGSTVAAAIPWIAGAAGILGVLKFGFGMGSKETTSQGISGTIADSGVTGQSYQNWMQKGGWFRSDKHGQDTQALTTDVVNSFMSGLTSMKSSATDFAKNLNVSADSLKNYSKTFDITLTSDASANQKAITEFFTTMGDDMATKLVPNIAEFAKQGETASVTLQRLSDTFKTTNAVMDLFGINSEKVFGGLGLESAKARQYIVDLAGGISNLGSQATFYAQNFLNAQEQIAPVQKAVTNALNSLGLDKLAISLSDTSLSASDLIGKFKDIVNGLNLVDPAQAQLFESLMQLAPAFKQVADAADAAKAAAEAQAKATHDAAVAGAKNLAQNDFNALSASITIAKNNAQVAYDAQSAILNAQISSLTATKEAITQLSTALDNTLHTMVDNTVMAMSRVQAQNLLDQALTTAKTTGKLPSAEDLKDVLSTLGKDPAAQFSSYADYIKDVGITAGKVSALNDIAKKQGTVADRQLNVAQQQLVQAKSALDQELAKYDMMLSFAQQQLDAANGTNVAIKTLSDAIAAFNASVLSAIQAQKGTVGGNGQPIASVAATTDDITKIYQNVLGRSADAGGLAYWQQQAESGMTASEITQWFMKSPEYLSTHPNGSHANGLDNVPFDGYTAKLHKGEMVLPARQAKGVVQGDDIKVLTSGIVKSNDELIAVTTAMKNDIRWLKKLYQQMAPSGDRLQMHDIGAAT